VSEETTPPPAAPLVLPTKPKRKGGFQKGQVSNPKGTPQNLGPKMVLYRKRMAAAVPRVFNERQLERTLKMILEVRDDERLDANVRLKAADLILERMLGKAKVDVEVEVNVGSSYESRLKAAMVAARLVAAEVNEVIDGTVVGATGERDLDNRVTIPSLPAPLHLRHDEVPGGLEGSPNGDHLQPVVQEQQEANVPPPGPAEDERTVRVEEPDGGERVHPLPPGLGGGVERADAGPDRLG
jgi:hypothetical protein